MARVPMVTRTIKTTRFEVMTVNVTTGEVAICEFTLLGSHGNTEKSLNLLKKDFETLEVKVVNIQSFNQSMDLYGMTEAEFVEKAQKLEKR